MMALISDLYSNYLVLIVIRCKKASFIESDDFSLGETLTTRCRARLVRT